MNERVRQARLDRSFTPRQIKLTPLAGALDPIGKRHEPFRRVVAPVEDHVLDVLQQIGWNVLVHDQLAGIDDAHVEAGFDRVKEKRRVHRLADDVVAAK